MLKPSGLKIPGRTAKHSSPVGRPSGTAAAAAAATPATKEGEQPELTMAFFENFWKTLGDFPLLVLGKANHLVSMCN